MFNSDDGRGFTNRPAMKAHNARLAAKKSKPEAHHPGPHGESTASHADSMPVTHDSPLMTCPECGAQFNEEAAKGSEMGGGSMMTPTGQ